ncbi:XRE family transcriptional regulator, partial [Xanthomonas citri pv. citri]|nr:XRE family transcriptional regulator [Xanthomonas citri pv. citri]
LPSAAIIQDAADVLNISADELAPPEK